MRAYSGILLQYYRRDTRHAILETRYQRRDISRLYIIGIIKLGKRGFMMKWRVILELDIETGEWAI